MLGEGMAEIDPELARCQHPDVTHHAGCACHELGWRNKWEAAVEMAAQAQVERDSLRPIVDRVIDWQSLSNEAMRLRCGELTAKEIRSIRAVLAAIKP